MSIREDFFAAKAKGSLWDVAVSIKRGNPLPLDADSIFESYAALEAYAADVLAYPGQVVAVVNTDSTGIYYLDQNLAIQPVGVIPVGDNKTIEVSEAGAISLLGAAGAANGTLPMIDNETGKLVWKTLEDIGAGDGNDNTTYEFNFANEKISITPKFNGVAQTAIELDLSSFITSSELEDALADIKVAENDKVLKADGTTFSAELGLKHENGKISLTGVNGVVIAEFSDADFIADGVLEDVSYNADTKELTFTWNIENDGVKKTDVVNIADLIDTYSAGDGLDLTNTTFSIKLANDSESFLSVDANGLKLSGIAEAINNAISAAASNYATAAEAEAIRDRLDDLEAIDHTTYATKEALKATDDKAVSNTTAIENLSGRIDDIVAEGGEPNQINNIKVNGVVQSIANDKSVDIAVPTKFSDLTDDSGFDARITAAKEQADKGVNDAGAAAAVAATNAENIAKHDTRIGNLETTKADHEGRILNLEAADIAHTAEYNTLKSTVDGHTAAIAGKAAQSDLDAVSSKASTNETAIKTLNDTTIPAINTEIGKKANSADVYTKNEIGTIPADKTLVQMIADAQNAATYDDTAIKASIKNNTDAIAILNSDATTDGSVAKIAADTAKAEVAAVIDSAPEAFDTLKEIATWISEDKTATEALVGRVAANESAIAAINNTSTGILAQSKAYTDAQIANIPVATASVLGLVKYDDSSVKMNASNQLYVAKVSTDILEQGTQTLILNGGNATD